MCVCSLSQMLLGQCCWPILSQCLLGLPLVASSQPARTSSACVPLTMWAEASSAKRLTGWCCTQLFSIHRIYKMLLVVCNFMCANCIVGFSQLWNKPFFPLALEVQKEILWLFPCTSTFLVFTPVGVRERWAGFGMGLFQDKTLNELKLCFVKTWWVRWPSFISLPPINSLRRTSWVKYREAWKSQSFTLRLKSQVNSLH